MAALNYIMSLQSRIAADQAGLSVLHQQHNLLRTDSRCFSQGDFKNTKTLEVTSHHKLLLMHMNMCAALSSIMCSCLFTLVAEPFSTLIMLMLLLLKASVVTALVHSFASFPYLRQQVNPGDAAV